jgi:serine/threonine protein kinase
VALQRETDKSQTLAHPNIITVYDFDRQGSIFFMTMESLTGTTLDDYIKPEAGTNPEVISYINDLANAIAYAHKRNIVHSDLKPANILITDSNILLTSCQH